MSHILRTWRLACGGTLSLTSTELIEDFRGFSARWSHEDFVRRIKDENTLTYRLILDLYGRQVITEILQEISKFNDG